MLQRAESAINYYVMGFMAHAEKMMERGVFSLTSPDNPYTYRIS